MGEPSIVALAEYSGRTGHDGRDKMDEGESRAARRGFARPVLGAVLILAGVLIFLQNMGIVRADWGGGSGPWCFWRRA